MELAIVIQDIIHLQGQHMLRQQVLVRATCIQYVSTVLYHSSLRSDAQAFVLLPRQQCCSCFAELMLCMQIMGTMCSPAIP